MRRRSGSRAGGHIGPAVGRARELAGVTAVAGRGASVHPDEPAGRRDGLPVRRGLRRNDGQPDRVELHGLRLGDHGRLDRDHAPEPRGLLLARPRAPERPGAGRADAAHPHARHAAARGSGRGGARRDGRGRPAADDGPARHRPRGRRARRPRRSSIDRGGWRRPRPAASRSAPVSLESDGWTETDAEGLRALGHEVALIEPRTPATGWAQVIRRLPDGSYEGGADPRADSLAAGP